MIPSTLLLAASAAKAAGLVIAWLVFAGFVVYALRNVFAGRKEVGSEIELAANLKPYYDDDTLETKKLDRALTVGLGTLAVVGIGLPAYWLAEPGRQEGAIEEFDRIFTSRGEELYTEGAQCNACHGPEGTGGVANYTILDSDNEFVAQVQWLAPAIDTALLRYDREEVTFILNYGRPYSPMPAWGAPGGGPLTEQQVRELVDYIESITISSEESKERVRQELATTLDVPDEEIDYDDLETGKALFNLGRDTGYASGAYACGRCHTRGWSIDPDPANIAPSDADLADYLDFPDGSGAYGPRLLDIVPRQFNDAEELAEFLTVGAVKGQRYGNQGLSGDGMMPGFGDNPNTEAPEDGMLTPEMITAIAEYVSSLHEEQGTE